MKTAEQILEDVGLGENERKVFLAALRVGLAPISRIAEEAKLGRTYAYELVAQLRKKGLLAEIEEKGVRKVEALDHEGLLSYVGRKQKELERVAKELLRSADAFDTKRDSASEKMKVRFFDGVEGIKTINAEIRKDLQGLRQPYKFHVVFSADRMESVLPGWIETNSHIYFEPFMRKYAIISDTPLLQAFSEKVRERGQRNFSYKVWPKEKGEFPTDTLAWPNKIAYLDMRERPSGMIVESKAIADTFVMWFEQMWGSLR